MSPQDGDLNNPAEWLAARDRDRTDENIRWSAHGSYEVPDPLDVLAEDET